MHTSARRGPITLIGYHTNEGPEGNNSAEGLKSFLLNNGPEGGGYQANFDNAHTAIVQPDNVVCWANGGVNDRSIDGCFVGYAHQTAQEWDDAFSRGELEQGAQWGAAKCKAYSIPAVRVTPVSLHDPNTKGIFGHIDVSNAGYANSAGHYDPGPNFPWTRLLERIGGLLVPIDWAALARIAAWVERRKTVTLEYGMRGPAVVILNQLLVQHGVLTSGGEAYGQATAHAVGSFRARVDIPGDSHKVDYPLGKALFS